MDAIRFKHSYHKLAREVFSTIRGKSWYRKMHLGQVMTVETTTDTFIAQITSLKLCRIDSLPVEFLKSDAEFPGFTISTQQDFCDLLNSFRARYWTQVTLDTWVTVITLRKITIPQS